MIKNTAKLQSMDEQLFNRWNAFLQFVILRDCAAFGLVNI